MISSMHGWFQGEFDPTQVDEDAKNLTGSMGVVLSSSQSRYLLELAHYNIIIYY